MPKPKMNRSKKDKAKRRLFDLTDQINAAWRRRSEDLLAMGKLLHEAKPLIKKKGGFKQWINDKFPFNCSAAYNYMRIAKVFESPDDVASFSVRSLILMSKSKFPEELRQDIVGSAKEGKEWTVKKIQKEWDAHKEDEDQEDVTSDKGNSKEQTERAKGTSASAQTSKKLNKLQEAFRKLIRSAEDAADIMGRKKSLTMKAQSNYKKRIKKVRRILETILEDVESK